MIECAHTDRDRGEQKRELKRESSPHNTRLAWPRSIRFVDSRYRQPNEKVINNQKRNTDISLLFGRVANQSDLFLFY